MMRFRSGCRLWGRSLRWPLCPSAEVRCRNGAELSVCKVQEGDGEFLTRDVAFFAELGQMEFESAEHEEVGGHFVAQVVQFLEDFS